ncbi:MAG: hypothetical protein H0V83_11095 [Rubrobacter sp.]|nr:hypothetical protein [Rubrobacter sp.]
MVWFIRRPSEPPFLREDLTAFAALHPHSDGEVHVYEPGESARVLGNPGWLSVLSRFVRAPPATSRRPGARPYAMPGGSHQK